MATTVVNLHHSAPYDVYIGRGHGSVWGNPFSHMPGTWADFRVATREEAISKYEEWILTQPDLLRRLGRLQGKVLGCWCSPAPCHGDVLARMADALPEPEDLLDGIDI